MVGSVNPPRSSPTQDAARKPPVGVVVALTVALFIASTTLAYEIGTQGASATSGSGESSLPSPVLLAINNPFNTAVNGSADQYSPANFSVPSNVPLEFIVTNYDNGINPPSPDYANVSGVTGDCVYLSSTPAGLGECSHSVAVGAVAHTFTIPTLGLNVPVPAVTDTAPGASGVVVVFFAEFSTPGAYHWVCMAPCDPASMVTPGFMQGTMTVT